jgi:hypothetical protein
MPVLKLQTWLELLDSVVGVDVEMVGVVVVFGFLQVLVPGTIIGPKSTITPPVGRFGRCPAGRFDCTFV